MLKYLLKTHVHVLGYRAYVCSCSVHLIVCCVHCYAVRLIIAFVDVNKTYLILSYLILSRVSTLTRDNCIVIIQGAPKKAPDENCNF